MPKEPERIVTRATEPAVPIGATVRRADPTDDDAILLSSLGARLFQEAFGPANNADDLSAFLAATYSPAKQLAELGDPARQAWIAESGGEAVGYALLRRHARSVHVVAADPAEVQRIYVARSLHGHGVADLLMRACMDQARAWEADALWLGVWERNPRAIAFYARWGFRQVGEQRFLVGSDAQRDHVMMLSLR